MYDKIFKLIQNGELNKAQEQLENTPENDPKRYNISGLIYYQKKEFDKAKEEFEKGLKINPVDSDLLFNYGYLLKNINQEKEAWRYLMRIHNKDWATYDLLGDIEYKNRSKLSSLRFYKKAAELPNSPNEMKKKFIDMRNIVKQDTKIAFLCLPGLDNFLKDIVETFSLGYDVKLVVTTDGNQIAESIKWADIVWLEWANEMTVFATNQVPEIQNKKVVCRLHRYEAFTQFPDKINWKNVDFLIFVAESMKKTFHELHPNINLNSCKEEIVYNGVDLDKFKFLVHKPGYNLSVLAHINYRKNPETWVQIIGKLKEIDNRYKLHVGGDFQDPLYKIYFDYIKKEMNLENNFILHGWINEVDKFLEDKDYTLSTSIHESFGYNIAEAMARGIKPIIHNFDGAKSLWPSELIYNTIDEAVEKITEQAYDSESYRRFIEDNYSLEKQIDNMEAILNIYYSKKDASSKKPLKTDEQANNLERSNNNISQTTSKDESNHENQFGKIWDEYSKIDSFQLMNDPPNKTLRSEFVSLLNNFFLLRNTRILEVGTGTGSFSIELALREAQVTGIDIEESSIKLAKRLADEFQIVPAPNFLLGNGFNLEKAGFKNFDIVFNMGVIEHFEDELLIKMLDEMGKSGKFVVVGVPWSNSQIYKLSKEFSKTSGTWEYGFERDFETLKPYFEKAGLYMLNESIIGGVSEAYYLKQINPKLINIAMSIYFEKFFKAKQSGNWLIAIGTQDKKCAELFSNLKNDQCIKFENNNVEIIEKKQPSVSIVVPVYNGEKYIKRCVENLLEIGYGNYEIVFVNDGSTDNTIKLLEGMIQKDSRSFPEINIVNLPKNLGIFHARLQGITNSQGEFVFFHNVDDLVFKDSLKCLTEDYRNFGLTKPLFTVSLALMKNELFFGEVWYSMFWQDKLQVFVNEFINLHGNISIINTLLKKEELEKAIKHIDNILLNINVDKMIVAEDSIVSDYLLANRYISRNIPVFYTYQGYKRDNELSTSRQLLSRISNIPINTAYLYYVLKKYLNESDLNFLEQKMVENAQKIYGLENGKVFVNNYYKYKKLLEKFVL